MNNSFSYHDFHVNQYMEAVTFIQCSQNPQNTIESPMTINKDKMGDQSSNNENNLYVCWDKIMYIDSLFRCLRWVESIYWLDISYQSILGEWNIACLTVFGVAGFMQISTVHFSP